MLKLSDWQKNIFDSKFLIGLNVFADGTVSNSDDPLLKGVPVIPKGNKMQGQFFPLLLDRSTI